MSHPGSKNYLLLRITRVHPRFLWASFAPFLYSILSIIVRLFALFRFGHCIICPFTNYGFWKPLWHLQTVNHKPFHTPKLWLIRKWYKLCMSLLQMTQNLCALSKSLFTTFTSFRTLTSRAITSSQHKSLLINWVQNKRHKSESI